jgi:hypothetical protein
MFFFQAKIGKPWFLAFFFREKSGQPWFFPEKNVSGVFMGYLPNDLERSG